MNPALLRTYHWLPARARSLAASVYGHYLLARRYGNETERLVEEAIEREYWDPDRWKAWQEDRLASILHRAVTQVPYYRKQWTVRHLTDRPAWECLENWPILEKETLRMSPGAFLADECDPRRMYPEQTSGTTGKPVQLWWSSETVRTWYALFEARCRRWYGVTRHDRWAILGGQLVTPVDRREPPFWVWNAPMNQLYMSSYHLAPDLVPHYLDALAEHQIGYLVGYTSSLYALAEEALRLGRRDLELAVVVTNAEPLLAHQREVIAQAFQCPVRETYGMAETVAAASECSAGRLHVWPEVGWIQIAENDGPVTNGHSGDLVCTGLLNADMPLIRYRVGDRGSLGVADSRCSCGRSLPTLLSLEGRTDDVLFTIDGRRIGRLDPVFHPQLPIREAQIVQEALGRLRIRYVPAPEFTPAAGRAITERLRARMGDVSIVLEQVSQVPRLANGKFRAVICNLPPDQRAAVP